MRHELDRIYLDDDFNWRKRVCYDQFCEVLWEVFKPKDYLDLGSARGYTLEWFAERKGIEVSGVEGASAAFKFMSLFAQRHTVKHDLRDPLDLERRFNLVCCMEVAEHLEPEFESVLLDTILRHMGRWLAFSAAPTYDHAVGKERQSHWNVQPYKYWERALRKRGLALRRDMRDRARALLQKKKKAYSWWAENLIVCETK